VASTFLENICTLGVNLVSYLKKRIETEDFQGWGADEYVWV